MGTFWLTFAGCGSAVVAAGFSQLCIGFAGVALAFGLVVGGRLTSREALGYILFQVAGAILGAGLLFVIANGKASPDLGAFATNGYGASSPSGYGLVAAALTEFVLTAVFLIVVLGATSKRNPAGFARLAIGLCLTLIHLISIPITNTSVNPARSTGPALFGLPAALSQLWLFWQAPCLGAVAGALIYKFLLTSPEDEPLPTLAHAKTVTVN